MNAIETRDELIRLLSADPHILGVGQTGSLKAALIPRHSDIDLFVLCTEVPTEAERSALYARMAGSFDLHMAVCSGGRWGHGDILDVGGIDVMPMYFNAHEMRDDLLDILARCPDREGRFYPVGRLASVSAIHVLFERDHAWSFLKDLVNSPQPAFFRQLYLREIAQVLDEEDLSRCEIRPEVLFFHQVLENALDHLLQALYAVNSCYFPSRKRTLATLDSFAHKPEDCGARLLRLVRDGSDPNTLGQAMDELRRLTGEVQAIGRQVFPGDN